jgi:tetratricopeptide (TPR) repeat protein
LGAAHENIGNDKESIRYYKQALEIVAVLADREMEGAVLNNLGYALYKLGEYPEAITYLTRAVEIYKAIFPEGHPYLQIYENNLKHAKEVGLKS